MVMMASTYPAAAGDKANTLNKYTHTFLQLLLTLNSSDLK